MSESSHILTQFDDSLKELGTQVAAVKPSVLSVLGDVEYALYNGDSERALAVGARAEQIGVAVASAETIGRTILVRFRPVATDLRFVLGRVRACRVLEELCVELSDMGKKVAALLAGGGDSVAGVMLNELSRVRLLFEMASSELHDAMDALETADVDLAVSVRRRDAQLDELHKQQISDLIDGISSPRDGLLGDARWLIDAVFLVRSIERIGDLAKNIADEVVFVATAKADYHVAE